MSHISIEINFAENTVGSVPTGQHAGCCDIFYFLLLMIVPQICFKLKQKLDFNLKILAGKIPLS